MNTSRFTSADLDVLNARLAPLHPREIIRWAYDAFGSPHAADGAQPRGGLIMTSSFGADSLCSIHLATQVFPDIPIVVINTGYLFPETLEFLAEMRERFQLNIREFHTRNDPLTWLSINGEPDPAHRHNVEACCAANKNEVMDRAMHTLAPEAWIRGVRADQSQTRAQMQIVQWSPRNNCYAISPILRWSSRDVFYYMKEHNLPHHPLWEKGYLSIGCNPLTCTRPVGSEDDARAGRWSGTDKKECGIHLDAGANI
ncbi:MAG TPA: phosphoadenylyl-sulfate reductase [Phycisphaerae bacterium]|nr:phosphoadenylyl-sulfate reductase [Phycisphaerae bacterium]